MFTGKYGIVQSSRSYKQSQNFKIFRISLETQILNKCFHFPVIRNSWQELEISPCNRFYRQTGKCSIRRHDNLAIWSYCASRWDSSTIGGNLLWYVFPVEITIWETRLTWECVMRCIGLPWHGENNEFGCSFFQTGKTGNLPEILKIRFCTRHLPPTDVIGLWWDDATIFWLL